MFIVRILPIARGIFTNELSFFSRESYEEGALLQVPVRGKTLPGIVLSSKEARQEKTDLKSAGFALKKIPHQEGKPLFLTSFIEGVREAALFHGTHESVIFAALTSSVILSSSGKLTRIPAQKKRETSAQSDLLVLQAEKEERIRTYRNLAREAFARGASLLIVTPTIIEAENLALALERGIEERMLLVTSELTKKKLLAAWNTAIEGKKPLLIVGTSIALSIPCQGIETIVLERESARAYRGIARPHADIRRAAELIARQAGVRLVLADFPLRVETRYRAETGEMEELARSQSRPGGSAAVTIVDSRKKDETTTGRSGMKKRAFKALSDESLAAIEKEIARGGRVALFSARTGVAPLTVCNDCGTPVSDKETGTPMVLHKTSEGNVFLSHRSGALISAETPCRTCGGWNLVTLGFGIDRIEEELKKAFPKTPITIFTREKAPTHKEAKKLSAAFFASSGSIVLGTERMLPYLTEPVELAIATSVDTLLSLPAWRAHEHVVSILFYLLEHAELSLIVETRKPEHLVMKTLSSGNPIEFYRTDIDERKRYLYPPFSTFIGLEWKGVKPAVEKMRLTIEKTFSDLDLVGPLPSMAEGKNMWSARAVIRLPKGAWPEEALAERLRALPPGIVVAIDPDEIV